MNASKIGPGLALSLCLLAATAQPLSIKGLELGAPKQEVLQRYPNFSCTPAGPVSRLTMGDQVCSIDVAGCMRRGGRDCLAGIHTYAGVPAFDESYSVIGETVERFDISIFPRNYAQVRDALLEAHGQQGRETMREIRTRAGSIVQSRVWELKLPSGSLLVLEHGENIAHGAVIGRSTAFLEWARAQGPASAKKGAKDL